MILRNINTIIWDWNGTLIDDLDLCVRLVSEALAPFGVAPITPDQYRAAYQHPIKEMYIALGADLDDESFRRIADSFLDSYEAGRSACALHDGVPDVLGKLKEAQKRQVLLSAHRHDLVLAAITDYELVHFFEEVSGLELAGGHGKTDNGHILVKKVGAHPDEVLMVGDSFHDHEVAESLGVECHLISRGADCRTKLEKSGRPVFDSLREWATEHNIL